MTKPKITPKLLAKDVLKLLALKKLKPITGEYYLPTRTTIKRCSKDLQKAIKQAPFSCSVCALGAIFVAHVGRVNEAETQSDFDRGKLLDVFGNDQLDLIEGAFERWSTAAPFGASSALQLSHVAAHENFSAYKSDRGRLVAIMENIVKHGEFKPEAK